MVYYEIYKNQNHGLAQKKQMRVENVHEESQTIWAKKYLQFVV